MKKTNSHHELLDRRGELMAELFLEGLDPVSIARPPQDFGYDLLVVFKNSKGGINTFGVAVKATERPIPSRFVIDRRTYDRLVHSTLPGLLLVADVKQNKLFFARPPQAATRRSESSSVSLPLTPVDSETKAELHKTLVA